MRPARENTGDKTERQRTVIVSQARSRMTKWACSISTVFVSRKSQRQRQTKTSTAAPKARSPRRRTNQVPGCVKHAIVSSCWGMQLWTHCRQCCHFLLLLGFIKTAYVSRVVSDLGRSLHGQHKCWRVHKALGQYHNILLTHHPFAVIMHYWAQCFGMGPCMSTIFDFCLQGSLKGVRCISISIIASNAGMLLILYFLFFNHSCECIC